MNSKKSKIRFYRHSGESQNHGFSITYGCRIKACPGLDPGSGMTKSGFLYDSIKL
jgi:hypothetical protein